MSSRVQHRIDTDIGAKPENEKIAESTIPVIVTDASAILALVLSDETGPEVEKTVRLVCQHNGQMIVPALFWYEVTNGLVSALRKGRLSADDLREIEANLEALPFSTEPVPDAFIRQRIREYALNHNLSYYDAAYLETALRLRIRIVSRDKHLLELAETYPDIF